MPPKKVGNKKKDPGKKKKGVKYVKKNKVPKKKNPQNKTKRNRSKRVRKNRTKRSKRGIMSIIAAILSNPKNIEFTLVRFWNANKWIKLLSLGISASLMQNYALDSLIPDNLRFINKPLLNLLENTKSRNDFITDRGIVNHTIYNVNKKLDKLKLKTNDFFNNSDITITANLDLNDQLQVIQNYEVLDNYARSMYVHYNSIIEDKNEMTNQTELYNRYLSDYRLLNINIDRIHSYMFGKTKETTKVVDFNVIQEQIATLKESRDKMINANSLYLAMNDPDNTLDDKVMEKKYVMLLPSNEQKPKSLVISARNVLAVRQKLKGVFNENLINTIKLVFHSSEKIKSFNLETLRINQGEFESVSRLYEYQLVLLELYVSYYAILVTVFCMLFYEYGFKGKLSKERIENEINKLNNEKVTETEVYPQLQIEYTKHNNEKGTKINESNNSNFEIDESLIEEFINSLPDTREPVMYEVDYNIDPFASSNENTPTPTR